eukprot:m.209556 g.209556  ORF g.209556 m.209556 type:complete len:496 (+) comp18545_c0_seq1:393-1880(+)
MAARAADGLLTVLTIALCVLAVGASSPKTTAWFEEPEISRVVRGAGVEHRPLTLTMAKQVHTAALNSARRKERANGHLRVSANLPPRLLRETCTGSCDQAAPPTIYPTDFGADPTGQTDSTKAFAAAVAKLLAVNGSAPGMATGITDLGGPVLDLAGGVYQINAPIAIPKGVGNLHIADGTLRAGPAFPADQYLISVGETDCHPPTQGSCNEYVGVENVLLDANYTAAGGVFITHVMGATLRDVFVVRFPTAGVFIDGGHETMITDSWFTESYWTGPKPSTSVSVGVQINGNDHFLSNVIVFDFTRVGVEVNGAANILSGVHTWNGGGIGIAVNAYQTRLIGCYLDYNFLQIQDPYQTVVENTFFLQTRTHFTSKKGVISKLIMRFNTYTGGDSIVINGTFSRSQVSAISIEDEINANKVSKAAARQYKNDTDTFEFDFGDQLLFPWIDEVIYSVVPTGPEFVEHVANLDGTKVTVTTNKPISGLVSVRVAQAPA